MRSSRCSLVAVALATLSLGGSPLLAQPIDENRARAEQLFEEANAAMGRRDFALACPKFEEVVRLQPQGIGAKMSLADCFVGEGKIASASKVLEQAAELATRSNQEDRANTARERIRSLAPRLSKIFIAVPEDLMELKGLSVQLNGAQLSITDLNLAAPVDRGAYTIVATAPGRRRFEKTLTVVDEGTSLTATVSIPVEETKPRPSNAPIVPAETEPMGVEASPWSGTRIAGIVIGVAGVGLTITGVAVGVDGASRMDVAAEAYTRSEETNDDVLQREAEEEHAAGESQSTAGWIVLGIGGAATVTGVIMAIAAPSAERVEPQTLLVPWATDTAMGTSLIGSW